MLLTRFPLLINNLFKHFLTLQFSYSSAKIYNKFIIIILILIIIINIIITINAEFTSVC